MVTGPASVPEVRYLVALSFVAVLALVAKNLVRGNLGRTWMAIRDMDVAAEVIGIRPLRTKLSAFAISSYFCGVSGSMLLFLWLGSIETIVFDINVSFLVLFMIIVGGLGSILGSLIGAAFITIVPIILTNIPGLLNIPLNIALAKHIELMIFGGIIILFLIVEPLGLARLWQIGKAKLRIWPFPH
jgi:branched-chain amino acid transport system permease protein